MTTFMNDFLDLNIHFLWMYPIIFNVYFICYSMYTVHGDTIDSYLLLVFLVTFTTAIAALKNNDIIDSFKTGNLKNI